MDVKVSLSDKELIFLQSIANELNNLKNNMNSVEDAIHECIRMAMYDESEETATEEGM
jgi:hypothetical protein